jgi:hypothetical protein
MCVRTLCCGLCEQPSGIGLCLLGSGSPFGVTTVISSPFSAASALNSPAKLDCADPRGVGVGRLPHGGGGLLHGGMVSRGYRVGWKLGASARKGDDPDEDDVLLIMTLSET